MSKTKDARLPAGSEYYTGKGRRCNKDLQLSGSFQNTRNTRLRLEVLRKSSQKKRHLTRDPEVKVHPEEGVRGSQGRGALSKQRTLHRKSPQDTRHQSGGVEENVMCPILKMLIDMSMRHNLCCRQLGMGHVAQGLL